MIPPVLYLASTSPRRRDLLQQAGIPFAVIRPGPEPDGGGSPWERAVLRARSKAEGAAAPPTPGPVLGVDTVVDLDGRELGKPRDRAEAGAMLLALCGREHAVHTALCVVAPGRGELPRIACDTAIVRCGELLPAAIERYLDTEEWRDKAGGYGIQGHGGALFTLVRGELDTVIGLPVRLLRRLLHDVGDGG